MTDLIKVVGLKATGEYRLWVRFSDGQEGVRDYADMIDEGGEMVEPLRDPVFFSRVFIEYGVPAWPNGFDVDAAALHAEMSAMKLLSRSDAA